MEKVKINIATIGHMPADFNKEKIEAWKSSLFEVVGRIEGYDLTVDADDYDWSFTDSAINETLPKSQSGDFTVAIVNVPLELNWYSRRLPDNKVVFTFHQIRDILLYSDIPLENIVYRLLYAYTLLYLRSNNRIPSNEESTKFTHDETRGCLFDMNGDKTDIVYSCHQPILCDDCVNRLRNEKVSKEKIKITQNEIKKIRKPLFYTLTAFIKKHPIYALLLSSIFAIALGVIGSLIANIIWEKYKHFL